MSQTQNLVEIGEWSITDDGTDRLGRIFMLRLNGKPYTRTVSLSQARHALLKVLRGSK